MKIAPVGGLRNLLLEIIPTKLDFYSTKKKNTKIQQLKSRHRIYNWVLPALNGKVAFTFQTDKM